MRVYLDHAATTPMVESAITALNNQLLKLGNPSSLHTAGRSARKDLEEARELIAKIADCAPSEIIFTGSGTEANNSAIKGLYWTRLAADSRRKVIVISAFEHHAILDPVEWLAEDEGAEIIQIPILSSGVIDLEYFKKVISERAGEIALVSVMHSNNEVGSLQPISEIVKIANEFKIPVHSDAVQSFGKVPFSFAKLGLTAATLSGHKIGGPLGIGILILKRGLEITPILHGGGQERDIRSGTLNAPAIVSFAAAAKTAAETLETRIDYVSKLRIKLISEIGKVIPDITVNGATENSSLPGIANITFPGTESDALLLLLDAQGIASSTGSACSAGVPQPSHVLMSMGLSAKEAKSSLRFSISATNNDSDIEYLVSVISEVVTRARAAQVKK